MQIAIHNNPGSFSDRWITYCKENKIDYKIVNCYDSDIIQQLDGCNGLMWHWSQNDYKAVLFARQLIQSLQEKNIKVFPDTNTCWHFDDKVGQKYLLESVDAPLVKSYAFYSKKDAINWVNITVFPKVFKLRGGAGSTNVRLIKTRQKAKRIVSKAFRSGFLPINRVSRFKDRLWGLRRDRNLTALKKVVTGFGHLFIPTEIERFSSREKGYVYFQDFISDNNYDTRLVVVGNRCFGLRRYCRKGDFRASGSGLFEYGPKLFDKRSIRYAFETARKLQTQSLAFDFVMLNNDPKIVEVSYCYTMGPAYDNCPGYWDENLQWHGKPVNPQYFIIEDFIQELNRNVNSV